MYESQNESLNKRSIVVRVYVSAELKGGFPRTKHFLKQFVMGCYIHSLDV